MKTPFTSYLLGIEIDLTDGWIEVTSNDAEYGKIRWEERDGKLYSAMGRGNDWELYEPHTETGGDAAMELENDIGAAVRSIFDWIKSIKS
jgi:hypothetical protein